MNSELINALTTQISRLATQHNAKIKLMEVCGTHTHAIAKSGLKSLLPSNIDLISGPGCPVCVTPSNYLDQAIELANRKNTIIATFGDMVTVPGSLTTLLEMKANGAQVEVLYSPWQVLQLAEQYPSYQVVFLAVGFETTAPVVGTCIQAASSKGLTNLTFLTSLKRMRPILIHLASQPKNSILGFICPGHVATIVGSQYFDFLATNYQLATAICGFDALDILAGIHSLVSQIASGHKTNTNLYGSCVSERGNLKALHALDTVFEHQPAHWRGIGKVEDSGLAIAAKWQEYDARYRFNLEASITQKNIDHPLCKCGDILMGRLQPNQCSLFATTCTPKHPVGPCMVSSEGSCAAYYHYRPEKQGGQHVY